MSADVQDFVKAARGGGSIATRCKLRQRLDTTSPTITHVSSLLNRGKKNRFMYSKNARRGAGSGGVVVWEAWDRGRSTAGAQLWPRGYACVRRAIEESLLFQHNGTGRGPHGNVSSAHLHNGTHALRGKRVPATSTSPYRPSLPPLVSPSFPPSLPLSLTLTPFLPPSHYY